MESRKILSVSQLNEYVKSVLEGDCLLQGVVLRGEISNFKYHLPTGHMYFSLKDQDGAIAAAMFRSSNMLLQFKPSDGMKVIVTGYISIFTKTGQYQIIVESMQPDGLGSLYLAYEQLKRKLMSEGLFSDSHKRPLPQFPKTVGVITAETGAALQDILKILKRRYPVCSVTVYPTLVQGPGAAAMMTEAVRWFSTQKAADVLIIGRGGGSIEDLWAFNDETLAREIFNCSIPVISAVGHETDFTICDYVADVRAPTPSAAAELAVPDREDLLSSLSALSAVLTRDVTTAFRSRQSALDYLAGKRVLTNIEHILDPKRLKFAYLADRLASCADRDFEARYNRLTQIETSVTSGMDKKMMRLDAQLSRLCASMDGLSPLAVLGRGYSLVRDAKGKAVTKTDQLSIGSDIDVKLSDGSVRATVDQIIKDND
ncbi:MAG: exodeoxyribonuclease VII large subunit [Clostridia bacterium]|nr:exodeoxyribonuclease VII large subunit [Clostridia bacterium]